jgi:hypothetical protein
MPKIGNFVSQSEKVCDRCRSPRKVSKKWTEKIQNDHGGFMLLEHKQIICTNKECQKAFEEVIEADNKKRAKIHETKMENMAKREEDKKEAKKRKLALTSGIKSL